MLKVDSFPTYRSGLKHVKRLAYLGKAFLITRLRERQCCNYSVVLKGAKCFAGGATNLCLFVEHELLILISELICKKKVIAPNWPTFVGVFCRSPKKKEVIAPNWPIFLSVSSNKKGHRANIFKLPLGKKFRTIMGSLGRRRPLAFPWLRPWREASTPATPVIQ